jgi:hypothetical protein
MAALFFSLRAGALHPPPETRWHLTFYRGALLRSASWLPTLSFKTVLTAGLAPIGKGKWLFERRKCTQRTVRTTRANAAKALRFRGADGNAAPLMG